MRKPVLIAAAAPRWIRLTLHGNYDGASGWGWIHLMQSGDRVSGCYEFQSGAFDGMVEGRVMRILMRANDGGREVGLFQFSPDGRKMVGLVRGDDAASRDVYAGYYSAEKTGDRAGGC